MIKKAALLIILFIISKSTISAPKIELWTYWQQHNQNNTQTISHAAWQNILNKYVVQQVSDTRFNYQVVSVEDSQQLKRYIIGLSNLDPRQYALAEQYAYWVNLYNALTVDLILQNYPIQSITKLGGFFDFGPWDETVVHINKKSVSLNDIEHRILRPIWKDPRTHYALNCASIGCPNLQSKAFTAENSEQLLTKGAVDFINSDKGVQIKGDTAYLSSIYDWFSDDFGGKGSVFKHIAQYAPQYANFKGNKKYQYNWQLNDIDKSVNK